MDGVSEAYRKDLPCYWCLYSNYFDETEPVPWVYVLCEPLIMIGCRKPWPTHPSRLEPVCFQPVVVVVETPGPTIEELSDDEDDRAGWPAWWQEGHGGDWWQEPQEGHDEDWWLGGPGAEWPGEDDADARAGDAAVDDKDWWQDAVGEHLGKSGGKRQEGHGGDWRQEPQEGHDHCFNGK